MALPLTEDFKALILGHTPLIDVRAPIEFAKGAFPTAVNLPLMNDEEREAVGICYKQHGNEAAVALGHARVSGKVRQARIEGWRDFIQKHPDAVLYCFRGGQRSRISQEWIADTGLTIPRIKGGYKAFRNYLIRQLESMEGRFTPLLLGGRTGSGKTLLLHQLDAMIDLEGLAKHRGSAFGSYIEPQPTQIDFENRLAFDLIEKLHRGFGHLVFEDEGKNVGRLYLPPKFFTLLAPADIVLLETPLHARVDITYNEYVTTAQKELTALYGVEKGLHAWGEKMGGSIDRIRKRLGSERHRQIRTLFEDAMSAQLRGDATLHKRWIERLLSEYYDPMYDYQLGKKEGRVIFKGDHEEVLDYLRKRT